MTSALYALTLTLCGIALFEGIANAFFGNSRTKGHVLFVFSLAGLLCVVNLLLPLLNGQYEYPDLDNRKPEEEVSVSRTLENAIADVLKERFDLGNFKVIVRLDGYEIEKVDVELYDVSDFLKLDKIKSFLNDNVPCENEVRGVG